MIKDDAMMVFVEKPYMVVVEAKRTEVLDKLDSKAQLLAQIRSLQIQWLLHSDIDNWLTFSDDEGRTGAITDGHKWSIFHVHKGNWYMINLLAEDEASSIRVLRTNRDHHLTNVVGILVYLVAGRFPSTDPNDVLWFSE